VIALALASLIIIVIISTMLNSRRIIEQDLDKLEFISEATIFLEYVKRDIRNARRSADSVLCAGDSLTILTQDETNQQRVIEYRYKRDNWYVGRKIEPANDERKVKWFGRVGPKGGIITDFVVKPVEGDDYRGFYQVMVSFMAKSDYIRQKNLGVETPKANKTHTFQALVNRRTPDSVDDKWNSAFRN